MGSRFSRRNAGIDEALIWIVGIAIFVFMALPAIVIIASAFSGTEYPQFPPSRPSLRWFYDVFGNRAWKRSIYNSMILLIIVTIVSTTLGTMASYGLYKVRFKGSEMLQAFLLSPLIIPQIILGVSMLYVFSAIGWMGTFRSLVIGQVLIAFPYTLRTVSASMASLDVDLERISMSLGATPFKTFRDITLPLLRPGIIAGGVFAAVTSFGEVSVSLLLSAPTTTPVSVRVFHYIEQTFDPSVNAVSVIFIAISIVVLFLIERSIGLFKVF
jgi:putative spermidine/putrescine transport system permease protein